MNDLLTVAQAQFHPVPCTDKCWGEPRCRTCGKRKAPRGRSVSPEMAASMCDFECSGYDNDPLPGHFWSGEELYPSPPFWQEET